jgi:transposase
MSTVTVLASPERRRRWTPAEKQRIVEESLTADTTVAEVARRHDIHPNLLHLWRRQARSGTVAPVGRESDASANEVRFTSIAIATEERVPASPSGMIEVELANGTRLRITGSVDAATVSAAIAAAVRGDRHR